MVLESNAAHRPWLNLEQVVVHLEDQHISRDALKDAWESAARLHPSLRAAIDWRVRFQPRLTVMEAAHLDIDALNWRALSPQAQTENLEAFLAEDRKRGVDLEANPCWRVTLIQLAEKRSVMVWTIHHALTDGRSMAIVLEDVFSILDTGTAVSTTQSADTALTVALTVARGKTAPPKSAETFFSTYLSGFDPLVLSDAPAAEEHDRRRRQLSRLVEQGTTARLDDVAQACGGTLNNLVQAAWGVLLGRWHNSDDIVFGTVRSGRHVLGAAERATGCFINTLPMRVKTGAEATLGTLVSKLRRDTLAMHPFEQVPVAEIRRMCGLHGAAAMFDTVVMFERGSLDTLLQRSGARWANRRVELREESDMPISLSVYADTEMRLDIQYDPGLLPDGQAERMLEHLGRLLGAMADADPETPLSALNMFAAEETAALLALGQPETGPVAYFDVVERFRSVAAHAPDAIAVQLAADPGSLSYAALDRRSDALAVILADNGAAPGEIVAIHLGRSLDYFVALLSVLKTGAAFLPVDPSYPPAVTDHMVRDSRARLVISETMSAPKAGGARLISPRAGADADGWDADGRDAGFAPVARAPGDPAYVIYTSGSTGTPKGVVISNHAQACHTAAIIRFVDLDENDRVGQFASLSFDFSIEEIVPTLLTGATLVLRSDGAAGSVQAYLEEITAQAVTVMNLPTSFFHVLTEYLAASGKALPRSVRVVDVGGERINPHILEEFLRLAPGVRFLNGYGPTETTVTATFYEAEPGLPKGDVPIGTAVDHVALYVVAPDESLSPRGAIGELWIGGVGVGAGYLGQPEKTAAVFRDDRFRGTGRVYRSGDRACWRTDGNLDFFGRDDRQVKMRGFRIDLGHVERVLETTEPGVTVIAAVRDPNTPSARLLAWAKAADGTGSAGVDALNAVAEAELPPAMRPRIIAVSQFPRTAGGKIDVAALPDPKAPATRSSDAPMSKLEAQIAGLMTKSLGGTPVGPDDDFYNLGGHSLLAAELVGRIETELNRQISVLDLRQHPTPRGLAKVAENGSSGPRHIFPIQPNGSKPPLFAVHILGGWDSYYTALAEELGPDQPILGVTVGALAQDKPTGIEATARCYFEEIQKFHPDGPVNLAAVSLGAYFAWELARQLRAAGREIGMLFLFDAAGPGGRDSVSGLRRIQAGYLTLRHRGFGAIPRSIAHRVDEVKHRAIARRHKRHEDSGRGVEIRTGDDFIAANAAAVDTYTAAPVDVPLTIFRAAENLFDSSRCKEDGLGWRDVASAGYRVQDVPGGHLSLLDRPHVSVLAAHMSQALAAPSLYRIGKFRDKGKDAPETGVDPNPVPAPQASGQPVRALRQER